jgi:type II restriction/modification system DNA methylase subunit YeeA
VALARAETRLDAFMKRLDEVRVLDPACGSGNFLYLAMQGLKDLERRAIVEAAEMGLAMRVVHCGPHNVKGIEINNYAAELARTSIWIGNIQWLRRNGFEARKEPVLEDLDAIECRDALVAVLCSPVSGEDFVCYVEAEWPDAQFIVGNPPFLGDKLMVGGLGLKYVEALREIYADRVPGRQIWSPSGLKRPSHKQRRNVPIGPGWSRLTQSEAVRTGGFSTEFVKLSQFSKRGATSRG